MESVNSRMAELLRENGALKGKVELLQMKVDQGSRRIRTVERLVVDPVSVHQMAEQRRQILKWKARWNQLQKKCLPKMEAASNKDDTKALQSGVQEMRDILEGKDVEISEYTTAMVQATMIEAQSEAVDIVQNGTETREMSPWNRRGRS